MSRRNLSSNAAIAVLSIIFFTWGGLTSLNDVLIPHLKAVFEMNYARTMLIQFTFFSTYLVMSLPAGRVMARVGYRPSMVIGLIIAALGALAFYPAAKVPSYPLFLLALFVLASGITLLQVSANPYISLLGEPRGASSRLTLAQALNSLGHTLSPALIGPLILSVAVLGSAELAQLPGARQEAYRIAQAESVQLPYLAIAGGLLLLASCVYLFRLPPLTEATEQADPHRHTFAEALRHRQLRLGVIAIFVYVGAEVTIGSFLISYIAAPRIGNIDAGSAAHYVSYYWGAAMTGRFIGSALLRRIAPRVLLCAFALVAIALLATTIVSSGALAMWSVIGIGLFNSIMFPTIFSLACEGLGSRAAEGSGIICVAIVGGAVVPLITGHAADWVGLKMALIVPGICYAGILSFGLYARHSKELNASRARDR